MGISVEDLQKRTGDFGRQGLGHGHLPSRSRAPRAVGHDRLGRRPRRRAARHLRGQIRRPSSPTRHPGSSTPRTVARRGCGSTSCCPTSASTRWPAVPRASTPSSRPASTTCAEGRGTPSPAWSTWTSTACGPRSASRRSCPVSWANASPCGRRTRTWPWPPCGPTTTGISSPGAATDPDRLHPPADRLAARPGDRGRGDPPQRRSRASRR